MFFTRYTGDVPPGMEHQPVLYMLTLFSLLLVDMLALEWMWRLGWDLIEDRLPLKHPGTSVRVIIILLLFSMLMRVTPDTLKLALWSDFTPDQRMTLFGIDSLMDTLSFIPFSLAWLVAFLGGPMIVFQLRRFPLPLHLMPTLAQMKRPLKIGVAVMIIAVTIVLVG